VVVGALQPALDDLGENRAAVVVDGDRVEVLDAALVEVEVGDDLALGLGRLLAVDQRERTLGVGEDTDGHRAPAVEGEAEAGLVLLVEQTRDEPDAAVERREIPEVGGMSGVVRGSSAPDDR
jgi:hypothetical protein